MVGGNDEDEMVNITRVRRRRRRREKIEDEDEHFTDGYVFVFMSNRIIDESTPMKK